MKKYLDPLLGFSKKAAYLNDSLFGTERKTSLFFWHSRSFAHK